MAIIEVWTEDKSSVFDQWLKDKPDCIKDLARRFPPYLLYRMKSSGHRVTIYGYHEDGSLSVSITGTYNRVIFNRHVFGVLPADLIECDLPGPGEPLGVELTELEDVLLYMASHPPETSAGQTLH